MEDRSIAVLERAVASVQRVIDVANEMILGGLGDQAVNEQRIIDGEIELAALQQEITALRDGDLEAMRDAATTMPPLGHELDPGAAPKERR